MLVDIVKHLLWIPYHQARIFSFSCTTNASDYHWRSVPEQLVWGKEDAGSFYARGREPGKDFIESALTSIHELVRRCDSLQGFILSHSLGGGTGSGLTSLLLDRLRKEYRKKHFVHVAIQPSQHMSSAVVEPYNSILATYDNRDTDSLATILLDNEAISNICTKTCMSIYRVTQMWTI